mgnify:CR=1 FL=1
MNNKNKFRFAILLFGVLQRLSPPLAQTTTVPTTLHKEKTRCR